ncbi:MAG: EamA family transporter [Thermodesulfovibrionales bacterium]|nr:EamA family transporter [Thermodesulfovibrionales bacterium]
MEQKRNRKLGYLYVFCAAFFWASSGTASKFLFHRGITPFQLVQLRTTTAAFSLFLVLFIWRKHFLRIGRNDIFYFLVLGALLAATQFTYLYSISGIQVAVAILLQYMAPVLIAAYSVLFAYKKLDQRTVIALAGALAGCYFMTGVYSLDILNMNRTGILAGFASAAAFAAYTLRSEYGMQIYTPWTVVFYALFFAALIWNIFHPPLAAFIHPHLGTDWVLILYIGIFGTILPFGLYNEGIRLLQSTRASITATLEPVLAGFFAYSFLGEKMELLQITGAFLVIASILLLQTRKDHA